jgi:hypothetical protein
VLLNGRRHGVLHAHASAHSRDDKSNSARQSACGADRLNVSRRIQCLVGKGFAHCIRGCETTRQSAERRSDIGETRGRTSPAFISARLLALAAGRRMGLAALDMGGLKAPTLC